MRRPPVQLCSARASGRHHTAVRTLRPSLADQASTACCLASSTWAQEGSGEHRQPRPPGASVELWGGRRGLAESQPNPDSASCWPCELGQGAQTLCVSVSILVADTWWVVGRTQWDKVG